ncbi:-tRNA wybutosine-synthesizing protein 1 homolog [Babesia bigemina]|uniref:-tRNA wybutosine-synthesizing protein 1 homolog n=1 Tax=Babesia bigemina TaxID=5866 RepID=A0A061DDX5_BABBI|nr:-tRNA wybutosine-synthesizing protein 1 homolog [Babesia bigemina]CDR97769.1 -tRNA wybutosine-synthesizing protein 1 homolog [Babesia bigemina]|eukprot:XP_012769955.1 -tRNA wybutosine-synthesizing protein 1 homolog [Babesia bigemina]
MDAITAASVTLAYEGDDCGNDACAGLSSIVKHEFASIGVQCQSVRLETLLDRQRYEVSKSNAYTNSEANEDIACTLVDICRGKQGCRDSPALTTLVLVVDSKVRAPALDNILVTLQEWLADFRISKTLLKGLCCTVVACRSDAGTANTANDGHPSREVIDAVIALENSMEALGAHIILRDTLCFGPTDIGQIVTFTNLVSEAWDAINFAATRNESNVNYVGDISGQHALSVPSEGRPELHRHRGSDSSPGGGHQKTSSYVTLNAAAHTCCRSGHTATPNGHPGNDTSSNTKCCEAGGDQGTCHCNDALNGSSSQADDYTSDEEENTNTVQVAGCMAESDIENVALDGGKMVTETQRQSLTKQGYKLIGEHSAIKLCRWTKARVRGHGGCYKHTFYGIKSNQCMEMTPSLACANKCVFCWRHHTNPALTRWKGTIDDPDFLAEESVKAHLRLIKELRGIFDTKSDRLKEAMQVRHCALSLVGEPIMYPLINELLLELHQRNISSFLVTNAQFPKAMEGLRQVTQLYLSIDAADETSLKKIDRPLFRDFWARFNRCIKLLKQRKERTVFRLTLVKHFNITEQRDEIGNYGRLIELGEPDFIEIKAVTFCGTVHDNAITMENVPWHDEVIQYAAALVDASPFTRENYAIACEHRHSCCVLVAKKSFCVDGKWHTWIDYDKFHELYPIWKQATSGREFHGVEYSIETPEWALFGSKEQGFDPIDTRVYTKGRKKLFGPPTSPPSAST